MSKRRLAWIAGTLVLLLAAGYGVLWLTAPRHDINHKSFEAIKMGMTEQQVEAILGVPAGDYTTGPVIGWPEISSNGWAICWERQPHKSWISNEAAIHVYFDEQGLVKRTTHRKPWLSEESLWARLRRWLGIE